MFNSDYFVTDSTFSKYKFLFNFMAVKKPVCIRKIVENN
jgi:hypothetical protein